MLLKSCKVERIIKILIIDNFLYKTLVKVSGYGGGLVILALAIHIKI